MKADLNIMLTSSFTGWSNYMMDFGTMLKDEAAMKRFGHTMVVWDMHSSKPLKVLDVPGVPLEIRCAWDPDPPLLLHQHRAHLEDLADLRRTTRASGRPRKSPTSAIPPRSPVPVDISITADDKGLWVDTFMEGKARYYDISDPHAPKQVYEAQIGSQINMVSQSWDGKGGSTSPARCWATGTRPVTPTSST